MSNLVTVQKMNRVITVDVNMVDQYLREGYDQVEDGKIVKHATGGKDVSLAEYNKLLVKIKELEENSSQSQVADLKEEIKVLEAENDRLDKLVKQLKGQQNSANKR